MTVAPGLAFLEKAWPRSGDRLFLELPTLRPTCSDRVEAAKAVSCEHVTDMPDQFPRAAFGKLASVDWSNTSRRRESRACW